ncbi:hypothetical protein BDV37DRAFT_264614 [Aspergillus pseudonomiae]|uniref:Uncharacterized protein n=1 Tax=Aspergillus pseudonomiae TaxID=1506151 RepID=A0A5N7CUX4_9EURO|nr:uncharacterized protein BDV37DRAFT_264614 [Aspergillus pseudonomiae]KAE8397931.1 hypothetical protein BDV37DRAFT_264614 [Aspergillus pseudonomiae]
MHKHYHGCRVKQDETMHDPITPTEYLYPEHVRHQWHHHKSIILSICLFVCLCCLDIGPIHVNLSYCAYQTPIILVGLGNQDPSRYTDRDGLHLLLHPATENIPESIP